jgi:hypothetical protein
MKTETARSRKSGVRRCLRRCEKNTPRGDATGRPRWRSPFLGDPGANFFWKFTGKAHRRSRGGGKSENPAAVAGFSSAVGKSCFWTFPRNGFFHGPYSPMVREPYIQRRRTQ